MDISRYHKVLFEHFGFNFGFVSDLLENYLENPESVSDYWKNYFTSLLNNGDSIPIKTIELKPIEPQMLPEQVKPIISNSFEISPSDSVQKITGVGAKIIENMTSSLSIPTATSLRAISVKLLEENRRIINRQLQRSGKGKVSFTHIVAYAIVQSAKTIPNLNNAFSIVDGKPVLVKKPYINLGIAVDVERKDGSRSLIVPNIKNSEKMNFKEFFNHYNDTIEKARTGKLEPGDFQGTTISITNPGGLGTVSSTPRLMIGQGCIIAIGAIEYPAEFKAMHESALAQLGIGKVMNITNTYDHRIIQGAESGQFLSLIDNLLLGNDHFYDSIFDDLKIHQKALNWGVDNTLRGFGHFQDMEQVKKQALMLQLINMYRVRGHLIADINPLENKSAYHEELDPTFYGFTIWDYDRPFITGNLQGLESGTLREILETLGQTYCEKIGVEYMHIQSPAEKSWLQQMMEPVFNRPNFSIEQKKRIMEKLIIAEGFEHFLHTRFIGHKRFSLEGNETVIAALDHLLNLAASSDVEEILLGMAHRGRLNILSNIIGKSYENIFSEFEELIDPESAQGTGDVKYHLGASGNYTTISGNQIKVSVASNPSHLEFVNPVVEGITRAKQTRNNDQRRNKFIPVLLHGDAAFAGQGVVAETLNLSQLKGYRTGGTIHIIVNNQIGFTTSPEDARSSPYATDVAKMVQAPIFHVNGDYPEASLWVTELAFKYRQQFNKDVVIDIIGYRRHGHNEGDDPVYTQPLMYKKIKQHPSVKEIYQEKMVSRGVMSKDEIENMDTRIYAKLEDALNKKGMKKLVTERPLAYSKAEYETSQIANETKLNKETLLNIVDKITSVPQGFSVNPKLQKSIIDKRRELLSDESTLIDWAFGEALAFGSLLTEGRPVRLSGQDSARGTFSQRHLILTDSNTEEEINLLNSISNGQASIEALDSLLSEAAVLGFDFGYSISDPLALVVWEAQFGDFANGAQVIIDNFITSAYSKWQLPSGLVMLLPHGQEGQGPEHSSARLERFLILCAENNMVVTNPTTPAQYFHLLRRQLHQKIERPLIILTPKSLLRLPAARSPLSDFTDGQFQEIINDESIERSSVKRVILTSGKIYYELLNYRTLNNLTNHAIVRIEQYFPYYSDRMKELFSGYPNADKIIWVQEEPKNMGAWSFLFPKLLNDKLESQKLDYVGRTESPSPAVGSSKLYLSTQEDIIKRAFNL